jgi:hypothetical protein
MPGMTTSIRRKYIEGKPDNGGQYAAHARAEAPAGLLHDVAAPERGRYDPLPVDNTRADRDYSDVLTRAEAKAELLAGTSGDNAAVLHNKFSALGSLAVLHPAYPKWRLRNVAMTSNDQNTLVAITKSRAADGSVIDAVASRAHARGWERVVVAAVGSPRATRRTFHQAIAGGRAGHEVEMAVLTAPAATPWVQDMLAATTLDPFISNSANSQAIERSRDRSGRTAGHDRDVAITSRPDGSTVYATTGESGWVVTETAYGLRAENSVDAGPQRYSIDYDQLKDISAGTRRQLALSFVNNAVRTEITGEFVEPGSLWQHG